jgi:hypothetical protein
LQRFKTQNIWIHEDAANLVDRPEVMGWSGVTQKQKAAQNAAFIAKPSISILVV